MKNRWVTFVTGRVLVKIEGTGLERLINICARKKVSLWSMRKMKTGAIFFYISLLDLHNFRHIVRDFDCTVSFIRGEGIPFLWKRLLKNSGFLIGVFLFLVILTVLSNITWGIQINGANPETEHNIRKELNKLGIKVGTFHFFNQDLEKLQQQLTERVNNITWIGVELKGTTFHFQVVEKNKPKKAKPLGPQHLVAKKKAVIAEMFVEKGKPIVKVNQFVKKGQMLVSGMIGGEEGEQLVPAKGEVWGKTWYQSEVEYPLTTPFEVFTGKEKRIHGIKIGSVAFPVWGFGKEEFKSFETEKTEHPIRFLGWELPIAYIDETIRESESFKRELTKEEAVQAGKDLAKDDLRKHLPEDARIDKEIVLHETVENGKVKLIVYFQVIENIAKEKPITQGD
ncbi:sporulation protein YqfD [Siminovitchia sp. FSL H7-0308]|uniref:sporulation protein YqfD n=1 Tax=Siminovitchia sp. FSL H7-0308 TaxID=2921432 RepID=UPI0030EB63C1